MEVRRLLEEVLLLQAAADEANKLRSLAERQEEEGLLLLDFFYINYKFKNKE
jgi:hypothetical protein